MNKRKCLKNGFSNNKELIRNIGRTFLNIEHNMNQRFFYLPLSSLNISSYSLSANTCGPSSLLANMRKASNKVDAKQKVKHLNPSHAKMA